MGQQFTILEKFMGKHKKTLKLFFSQKNSQQKLKKKIAVTLKKTGEKNESENPKNDLLGSGKPTFGFVFIYGAKFGS